MECGRGQSSLSNRGQLNEPFPEPETQSAVPHNSQVICPQISVSINERTLLKWRRCPLAATNTEMLQSPTLHSYTGCELKLPML